MSPLHAPTPEGDFVAFGHDVQAVARWAEAQRIALVNLVEELRRVTMEADAAEHGLTGEAYSRSLQPPTAFLAAIDAMLDAARAWLGARTEEARKQSERRLEQATAQARSLMRARTTRAESPSPTVSPSTTDESISPTVGSRTVAAAPTVDPVDPPAPVDNTTFDNTTFDNTAFDNTAFDTAKSVGDNFWSAQPCVDGRFDSRETFWGELYEQQGFNPLRRFARSGS